MCVCALSLALFYPLLFFPYTGWCCRLGWSHPNNSWRFFSSPSKMLASLKTHFCFPSRQRNGAVFLSPPWPHATLDFGPTKWNDSVGSDWLLMVQFVLGQLAALRDIKRMKHSSKNHRQVCWQHPGAICINTALISVAPTILNSPRNFSRNRLESRKSAPYQAEYIRNESRHLTLSELVIIVGKAEWVWIKHVLCWSWK